MTLGQLAAELGLKNTSRLRHDIAAGKLTAEKLGRDWLVGRTEAERYRAQRRPRGRPRKQPPSLSR
jgi:hypothetical protein